MKFNWKKVEEKIASEQVKNKLLDVGIYEVTITDAIDAISKKGTEMITVKSFTVKTSEGSVVIDAYNKSTGEYYGVYWITDQPYFFKKNMFALGLQDKYEAAAASQSGDGAISAIDVVGKSADAIILQHKKPKKNGEGFYVTNSVAELLAPWDKPEDRLKYYEATKKNEVDGVKNEVPQQVKLNDEIPF